MRAKTCWSSTPTNVSTAAYANPNARKDPLPHAEEMDGKPGKMELFSANAGAGG
jgi:hypothetical protein